MNLYRSNTYMKDLDDVIHAFGWLKNFEGKSVFVTGATGLICSGIVDLLLRYSELHNNSVFVYGAGRKREKWETRFSRYAESSILKFVPYNAGQQNQLDFHADYIIHGAGNAYPKLIQKHPIDTMTANFSGMLELLEYTCGHPAAKTVFISSSEVYGKKSSGEPFREEEHGYIDILNPRASYGVGKMAAETLCASYASERNIQVSIVRPGHIYGPTAGREDNRVSSMFAYDVLEGKDIVLKSDGSQIRSYCYVLDCATAVLKVLLEGKSGDAYNISNPQSILSIREIAELFAGWGKSRLRFEIPEGAEKAAFNPMQNSSLNSEKLQSLGWKGLFDARRGTETTVKVLQEAFLS